jgi:hypothetical protein
MRFFRHFWPVIRMNTARFADLYSCLPAQQHGNRRCRKAAINA